MTVGLRDHGIARDPVAWSSIVGEADFERISADQAVMAGLPCIRGDRIPVATVVGLIADGSSPDEVTADFPHLTLDDVRDALRFAAAAVDQAMLPLPATA